MNSFKILNRQVGLFAVVGALLLAVVIPAIASAAQLTERSIALSSPSKGATGVTYTIKFKASANAEGAVIDFCGNTPLVGQECTEPDGFAVTGATGTGVDVKDVNTLAVTQAITAGNEATITLANIKNPSAVGPFYARIVTYSTDNLGNYQAANNLGTGVVDQGSASIIITDTIGVSGAVLESMTFCVAGNTIADGCTGSLQSPTLRLGEQVGDVIALIPNKASTGNIYTQITTNSATGAVVSLKSSTKGCGGLVRAGETNCDIDPSMGTDVTDDDTEAKFGVKTGASAGGVGTFRPFQAQPQDTPFYSPTAFRMNWVVGDTTGVTSDFGDPFLDTAGAPATNKNMTLTFGASVTNQTPAGLYSANLSLIATGKF